MPPVSRRRFVIAALSTVVVSGTAAAAGLDVPAPSGSDTCPVCGMFVAKYPEWVATIVFTDGLASHFDGAKCHFKFIADMPRFDSRHRRGDVRLAAVTEYYNLKRVDTFAAIYVTGSDVLGPMGHELVPFLSLADAEDFRRDHGGRIIPSAAAIDRGMLIGLDEGRF